MRAKIMRLNNPDSVLARWLNSLSLSLALCCIALLAGCAKTLSQQDLDFYKKSAYLRAYSDYIAIKTPDCTPPCSFASLNADAKAFLNTQSGQSFIKGIFDEKLRNDGWRPVRKNDGYFSIRL